TCRISDNTERGDTVARAPPTFSNANDAPADDLAWEVARDVYCLGPRGRTQTNVYFVRSTPSWVLIDAGWASDGRHIERVSESLFGAHVPPAAILLTHCH